MSIQSLVILAIWAVYGVAMICFAARGDFRDTGGDYNFFPPLGCFLAFIFLVPILGLTIIAMALL